MRMKIRSKTRVYKTSKDIMITNLRPERYELVARLFAMFQKNFRPERNEHIARYLAILPDLREERNAGNAGTIIKE